MPIYEYQCQACGAVVEELQKISDPPLKKCPECGANKLQKLVSAPSFRLSGTGWYETDFKSDSDTKRNLSSKDSEGDKKSDAKSGDKKAGDKKESKADGKKKADTKKTDNKSSGKKSTKTKAKKSK